MRSFLILILTSTLAVAEPARAEVPSSQPKAVPETRTELKQALDNLKHRQPRLPLPEPSEELKATLGDLARVNNGRMRAYYLAPELRWESSFRTPDPKMTLDRPYKTMFFWIVARANNCHYCLGHQEFSLARSGSSDDTIAALDGDWSEFTPAQQAAFTLVKKMTYEPYKLGPADLEPLRKHYTDLQILEIVLTASMNNEMSRWTDAMGIPQESEDRDFSKPVSERYKDLVSKVAAIDPDRPAGTTAPAAPPKRPLLESRSDVERALSDCRKRTARIPLVEEDAARTALGAAAPSGALPQWIRLLANFPVQGVVRIKVVLAAEKVGTVDPLLGAQINWIAARQDRAWYALGRAKLRLKELGLSDDDIYALDGPWDGYDPSRQAAFAVVRKLTSTPQLITDDDIAGLRKHFPDKEVAELIYRVTLAAFFDRLTEAAGLQLEP